MTPIETRRDDILDALADHVLDHGLVGANLRPLARAARTSDRMLLYYFTDKDALIAAILDRIAGRMTALLVGQAAPEPLPAYALATRLGALVADAAVWPYLRLWLEIAARAAYGDALYVRVGHALATGFLAWTTNQLIASEQSRAASVMARTEGRVVLKALGIDETRGSR